MHLTLHLTADCNMRCDYCYSPPRREDGMHLETATKALDFGARISGEKPFGVIFFGGEPLLRKDLIFEIVSRARWMEQKSIGRFYFKITTNGLLLDDEFLRFAVENRVLIAMSHDGVQPAHDAHRRTADGVPTYDLVLPRLKQLLEMKPYASILLVVNPDTAAYLAQSVSFLKAQGARYLIVSLNFAATWTEDDFKVVDNQYSKLSKLYIRWTRLHEKFYLSPFEVKLSSHINRGHDHRDRCELARNQISVDSQGYLFPCVQFVRAGKSSDWCIGHLDSGINEEARRRIHRSSEAEKKECLECAMKERCNNTCGCLNWQTTGSVNRISPAMCRNEQLLLKYADKIGNALFKERNATFIHKHYNETYPVLSLIEDTLKGSVRYRKR